MIIIKQERPFLLYYFHGMRLRTGGVFPYTRLSF